MSGKLTKYGWGIFEVVDYTNEDNLPWELREVSEFELKVELIKRKIIRFLIRLMRIQGV